MSIQALRERKSELARQANAMLANAGDKVWSAEDNAKYDALMDDIGRVNNQIQAHERQLDEDADRIVNDAQRSGARGRKAGEPGQVDILAMYLRNSAAQMSPEDAVMIRNAMSTTTPAEGGYTVASEVVKMVIESMKAFGGMRDVATVIGTDSGNDWNYPTSDGTGETGEWVAQNTAATAGDVTFGSVALQTWKASSKKIALPVELIQDSGIDVVQFVIDRLAMRLGRLTNAAYTVGSGTAQPFGVVGRSTAGKVGATGQTATVTYDDLVDLLHSVNSEYRRNGRWQLSDSSLRVIRKLKDTANRPIFTPGYEGGITQDAPDLLLGKPITINDDMPAMAANAKSILFGDFSKYVIRDVTGSMVIRRFDDSAFALLGQVGFCGWLRTGGNLLDAGAVKHYANSAT